MNRARCLAVLAVLCTVGCAFEIHFDEAAAADARDTSIASDAEWGGAARDTARDPEPGPATSPPDAVGPPDAPPYDDARPLDAPPYDDARPVDVQPPADVTWVETLPSVDARAGD